ncbi:MAG TPA: hypothetical protein VLT88_05125 [Desulfosarcina sp.]|nr:hypothetical protein [Desulfosarcina sp.]
MKFRLTTSWLAVMGLALWGCSGAPSPARLIWTSQPAVSEAHNALFRAAIEPRKEEWPYFTHFLLTLENRSDAPMTVDWNASRYVFDGKPQGVLVFEGIDPQAVGSSSVPSEAVAPGAVFTREVMPLRLIAWTPVRQKTLKARSITPGMFPAGTNGVRMVVRHAGGALTIPLSVRISARDAP